VRRVRFFECVPAVVKLACLLDRLEKLAHHDAMTIPRDSADSPPTLERAIVELCSGAGAGRTISPIEAAQAYAASRGEDELGWRSHLAEVRTAAIGLADAGRIVIYRKGKPADPHDFRGVYRLGLPRSD
jgi:hypothetical protein